MTVLLSNHVMLHHQWFSGQGMKIKQASRPVLGCIYKNDFRKYMINNVSVKGMGVLNYSSMPVQ